MNLRQFQSISLNKNPKCYFLDSKHYKSEYWICRMSINTKTVKKWSSSINVSKAKHLKENYKVWISWRISLKPLRIHLTEIKWLKIGWRKKRSSKKFTLWIVMCNWSKSLRISLDIWLTKVFWRSFNLKGSIEWHKKVTINPEFPCTSYSKKSRTFSRNLTLIFWLTPSWSLITHWFWMKTSIFFMNFRSIQIIFQWKKSCNSSKKLYLETKHPKSLMIMQ